MSVRQKSVDVTEVHGQLPGDLRVRQLAPRPRSPCSTADLNKLHFDQSIPGCTGIKVIDETLTRKESGNFNGWTHGAPVDWLDAPTDETYTFERSIVGPSVGATLSFLLLQCAMVVQPGGLYTDDCLHTRHCSHTHNRGWWT